MLAWQANLAHQLEQIHLIRCSLLPDESFVFVLPPEDLAVWSPLLDAFTDAGGFVDHENGVIASLTRPPCQARFEIRVVGVRMWFEVTLPRCTDDAADGAGTSPTSMGTISVRGEDVSRDAHERWHAEIRRRTAEIDASEEEEGQRAFPAYELLTQLTASLRQSASPSYSSFESRAAVPTTAPAPAPAPALATQSPPWHALITSHHLVSPIKRRTLHHLSARLALAGFAKVGYPGIMYAQGDREGVEAFVREVKGMQWLALRVRFVEPVPRMGARTVLDSDSGTTGDQWTEMTKIGAVLEWMRMRGREALVTNLGIGTTSKEPRR